MGSKKLLVLTIAIGDIYQEIAELTHASISAYADKVGADFHAITERTVAETSPHWDKFLIHDLLAEYERVLYLDTDIIVRPDTPDLFELVPPLELGIFNEGPFTGGRYESFWRSCIAYDVTVPSWDGAYYNTGVMLASRCHRELFRKPKEEHFDFYEQGFLNVEIARRGVKCFDLPYQFNRMCCMDARTGEQRHSGYMIHYAGIPDLSVLPELIRDDLLVWARAAPDYKFPRHIWIEVNGGLGDQVDAEPAVRYLREHIYPHDDVRLTTHFPSLFTHLDIPVAQHGMMPWEVDGEPHKRISLLEPDTSMWAHLSNLLCHTVDYSAICLLRRILPAADKQICLAVADEAVAEVAGILGDQSAENMVLVHAGCHWPSKSFPVEWWQDVIDGIADAGLTTCLIGKDDEDGLRGVLPVECRAGMIDTRNLLSLDGLIALISQAPVLLSNDSAPVHIAGAFDHQIILIPTCKHPDHILPYRNSRTDYKTQSLYRDLLLDDFPSAPTQIYGVEAAAVPRAWDNYLPAPAEVVAATVAAHKAETG